MNAAPSLHPSPRTLEVESLDSFDRLVEAGRPDHARLARAIAGPARTDGAAGRPLDVQGAIFLGCTFDDGVEDSLRSRGALIFPRLETVPFNPYRGQLYTPQELYCGHRRLPVRGHPRRAGVPVEHPARPAAPPGRHAGRCPA